MEVSYLSCKLVINRAARKRAAHSERNRKMKVYDNYEISPCRRLDDAGLPDPNGLIYEVCEPDEADVWTLYGHIPGEGVEAIGDFATREDAEEAFQRITGIPFGGHDEVEARVRLMHSGPRLLGAAKEARRFVGRYQNGNDNLAYQLADLLDSIIAEATGRVA